VASKACGSRELMLRSQLDFAWSGVAYQWKQPRNIGCQGRTFFRVFDYVAPEALNGIISI